MVESEKNHLRVKIHPISPGFQVENRKIKSRQLFFWRCLNIWDRIVVYVPGSKLFMLGMVISPLIGIVIMGI